MVRKGAAHSAFRLGEKFRTEEDISAYLIECWKTRDVQIIREGEALTAQAMKDLRDLESRLEQESTSANDIARAVSGAARFHAAIKALNWTVTTS